MRDLYRATLVLALTLTACSRPPAATRPTSETVPRAASTPSDAIKDFVRIRQAVAKGAREVMRDELAKLLSPHLKALPTQCNLGGAKLGFVDVPATLLRSKRPQAHPGLLIWRLPPGNAWEEPDDLPVCTISVLGSSEPDRSIHAEGMTLKGCGGSKVEVGWEERPEGLAVAHVDCARKEDPSVGNQPHVRVTGVEHLVIFGYRAGRFTIWLSLPTRSITTHVIDRRIEELSSEVSWIDSLVPSVVGDVLQVKLSKSETGSQQGCTSDTRCLPRRPPC